ncbi:solute carrier family 35 member F4-like [Sinocyclocheilus rhinocerous]|uniref:solute carrier family 35 member F4-like n=1 Tax=Sinocyclocheilus rhinocerous TaxID=307959 RepID=UPI0007B8F846|nr:PREDICTED: solute carrier family 35 member F4-like [Sinocyclocheilus rhinocerous]
MSLKVFLKRTAPFSILWTLTNYLYLLALRKLTATDVSALYCCHKAFVFLLSWIVLKDRFMGVRIVAAIMAITGIVMMAYADGFHGDSFMGVALAVGSASTSALYKVLFKMFLGSANLGEAAHFFSTMGFFNLIFISCVPLILYLTRVEHWGSLSSLPWGYLCGVAGLWLEDQTHPKLSMEPQPPNPPSLEDLIQAFRTPVVSASHSPMARPAIFSGEAADCGGFLLQCSLYFEMQSQAFPNDRAKVAFMISHLAGRALHWAQSMWESNSQAIRTLIDFHRTLQGGV